MLENVHRTSRGGRDDEPNELDLDVFTAGLIMNGRLERMRLPRLKPTGREIERGGMLTQRWSTLWLPAYHSYGLLLIPRQRGPLMMHVDEGN